MTTCDQGNFIEKEVGGEGLVKVESRGLFHFVFGFLFNVFSYFFWFLNDFEGNLEFDDVI